MMTKYISLISLMTVLFLSGCMQPIDVDVDLIPDQPHIKSVSVGVMSTNGLFNAFPNSLEEIDVENHTVKVYVRTFMSMEDIWASVKLEQGCTITPLEGAPEFGGFEDFSQPGLYRVAAASGATADWAVTIEQDPAMPDISCLANFWSGDDVKCLDVTYPSYSPSTVMAEKIDCNHVTLTSNFWDDAGAPMVLQLELGGTDPTTFKGTVTLLEDVSFSSWGYDMVYKAGAAGSYDLNTFELTFDAVMEGYQPSYPMVFYKE